MTDINQSGNIHLHDAEIRAAGLNHETAEHIKDLKVTIHFKGDRGSIARFKVLDVGTEKLFGFDDANQSGGMSGISLKDIKTIVWAETKTYYIGTKPA